MWCRKEEDVQSVIVLILGIVDLRRIDKRLVETRSGNHQVVGDFKVARSRRMIGRSLERQFDQAGGQQNCVLSRSGVGFLNGGSQSGFSGRGCRDAVSRIRVRLIQW